MRWKAVAMMVVLLLAGCSAAEAPTPTSGMVPGTVEAPTLPAAPSVDLTQLRPLVVQSLAAHLNVAADQVHVESIEEQEWPSAALGCPEPGFQYAQVVTPGALVKLSVNGQAYAVHTDAQDTLVLCNPDKPVLLEPASASSSQEEQPTVSAQTNAQQVVSQHAADFAVDASSITVLTDEAVTWPSSGLGCEKPGQSYLTVLTPGFRVIIEQDGVQYAYHAGRDRQFFLCTNPGAPAQVDR